MSPIMAGQQPYVRGGDGVSGPDGRVLPADVVMDAVVSSKWSTDVAAVPATRVDDLLLFPWPMLSRDEHGRVVQVVLDLTRWLISHPDGVCLPVVLADVESARACAEQCAADRPADLRDWASWWCRTHDDHAVLLTADDGGIR